jgi:hypothetical protein
VKIKDVVQESVYDYFSQRQAAKKTADYQNRLGAQIKASPAQLATAVAQADAYMKNQGPAPSPEEQKMVNMALVQKNQAQIDFENRRYLPVPSAMMKNVQLMSTDPLMYQFKNNYFTINNQDQWVFYNPTAKIKQAPVDAVTAKLLSQAADRDGIELGLAAPAPAQPIQPTAKPATSQPQVFKTNPARTGAE